MNGGISTSFGRLLGLAVVAFALVLAGGGVSTAGPPGTWTRITQQFIGPQEVGLARTGDRALHVAWLQQTAGKGDLMHTAITAAGVASAPNAIVTGWAGINQPDLVPSGDGLRVLFGGIRTGAGDPLQSLNTATAPQNGQSWSLQPTSATTSTRAYASPIVATVMPDGTPVSSWTTTFALEVQLGVDPIVAPQIFENRCCAAYPNLAVDATTGELVLAWYSLVRGEEGFITQTIAPAVGPKKRLTEPTHFDLQAAALSGRIGAPGVYLAYCAGQPCSSVKLRLHRDETALTVASATPGARFVNIAAGPSKRLWVMWMRDNKFFATRSNQAVSKFGPIRSLAPPAGTSGIWNLKGEGSVGPLDLFASVTTSQTEVATWHTQVYPVLTLSAARRLSNQQARFVFTVRDVGDPVQGARVVVAGKRSSPTDAAGRATLTFSRSTRARSLAATATLDGYVKASTRVVVPARRRP